MTARLVAIVPMRHTSERVPGKNYRPLGGRPLYHYIIEALRACPSVSKIVIDTDSPWIADDAARAFADVTVLERPAHLRAPTVPMNDVLLNTTAQVPADYYLQTHSTNPRLRPQTIEAAIAAFLAAGAAHDSLFGVTRLQTRLWTADAKPLNHDPAVLLRTQDLAPVYEENSCIYLFSREMLVSRHNRIGERPLLFEIARDEALDIDDETDWQIAESLVASPGRT